MAPSTGHTKSGSGSGIPAPTLLFVPDISGFARFVNETEISHSRHIIAELLEAVIDANELDLTVSEIEGDAILFFRPGDSPGPDELLAQVERMYAAFHTHLRRYEHQRICQCGACSSAIGLELKFVVHHGLVAEETVRGHSKLFGRDVILVHRLLKNDVPLTEYALFTTDVGPAVGPEGISVPTGWPDPQVGSEEYDVGLVEYTYLSLEPLRARVPEPTIEDFGLAGGVLVMEDQREIGASLATVFNTLTDLSFRHEWQPGLVGSDRVNHQIAQGGSTHRCVIKNEPGDPFWVAHDFDAAPELVTFTETEQEQGVANVFVLRKLAPLRTRIEVYTFLRAGPIKRLGFVLFFKRKFQKAGTAGLARLAEYCEGLTRDGREHPTQIVLGSSIV